MTTAQEQAIDTLKYNFVLEQLTLEQLEDEIDRILSGQRPNTIITCGYGWPTP